MSNASCAESACRKDANGQNHRFRPLGDRFGAHGAKPFYFQGLSYGTVGLKMAARNAAWCGHKPIFGVAVGQKTLADAVRCCSRTCCCFVRQKRLLRMVWRIVQTFARRQCATNSPFLLGHLLRVVCKFCKLCGKVAIVGRKFREKLMKSRLFRIFATSPSVVGINPTICGAVIGGSFAFRYQRA